MRRLFFLHGLSDREAAHPVVTVERGYNAKHLTAEGVIVHTVMEKWFNIGICETETNVGNPVKVYDKERCICDIVRGRKKMDPQVFQTAMRSYFSGRDKDIPKLMKFGRRIGAGRGRKAVCGGAFVIRTATTNQSVRLRTELMAIVIKLRCCFECT